MFLKICGITRLEDARHAVEHGATALGFVCWLGSPRFVTPERVRAIVSTLPRTLTTVGVFVDASLDDIRRTVAETGITTVQLHGAEPAGDAGRVGVPVLRSVTLGDAALARLAWPRETMFLLDAADPVRRGGTGTLVDWTQAAAVARHGRVILAGGLTSGNVAEAIATVLPFGVDVSSGVERAPGIKDADEVARFLASARGAYADRARTAVEQR